MISYTTIMASIKAQKNSCQNTLFLIILTKTLGMDSSRQTNQSKQDSRLFGKQISNYMDPPGYLTRRESSRMSYIRRREKTSQRGMSDEASRSILNDLKYIKLPPDESKDKSKNLSYRQSKNISLHSLAARSSVAPEPLVVRSMVPDSPEMVSAYFQDCIRHMTQMDKKLPLIPNYFVAQKDLSRNMREIVLDWIVEMHLRFKMFPNTLFLVVNIMDRYLAKQEVPRIKLQLVATAAFYIAAKYEETYEVPTLKDLVNLAAKSFAAPDILAMESSILKALDFNIIIDTCYKFFEPLARLINMETKNMFLCRYVLELTLFDVSMFKYRQSMVASACIYLINKIRKKTLVWSQTLEAVTGYEESQIRTCAKELCLILENANGLVNGKALRKKFSQPEYYEVTKIRLEKKQKEQ